MVKEVLYIFFCAIDISAPYWVNNYDWLIECNIIETLLFQEPQKIVLGTYHEKKRRGNKLKDVEVTDDAYYVPLLESLQQLLNDESILSEVKCFLHEGLVLTFAPMV